LCLSGYVTSMDDIPELLDASDLEDLGYWSGSSDTEESSSSESSTDEPPTPKISVASQRRLDMLSTMLAKHTYREVVEILHLELDGRHGVLSAVDAGKVLRKYARGQCRSARRCAAIETALNLWRPSLEPAPLVPSSPCAGQATPPRTPPRADPGLRVNEVVNSAEKRGSRVVCPDCRKSLVSRASFKRHYQSCHAPEFQHHQRNSGIWPCGSCGLAHSHLILSSHSLDMRTSHLTSHKHTQAYIRLLLSCEIHST
jgi:ribosomal protein L37AE/L43A